MKKYMVSAKKQYVRKNVLSKLLCLMLAAVLAAGLFLCVPVSAAELGCEMNPVRVGCFPLRGFCDIDDDGTLSGYGIDYTEAVCATAGWDYVYIKYSSWDEALSALSDGKIDLLAPAQKTAERSALYGFGAFPIGTEYGALMTLESNSSLVFEDYASFDGLSVGVVGTLVFLDDFKSYQEASGFSVNFSYYKDTPALVNALNAGEVDAIVANLMVKTDTMKLLARFCAAPYYFMSAPGDYRLSSDLSAAIDKLTSQNPDFQSALEDKYYPDISATPLSKAELDFIGSCGTVAIACGSCYPPFSYINEDTGEIDGVDRAMFEKIAALTGLSFEYLPIPLDGNPADFIIDNNIRLLCGVESSKGSFETKSAYLSDPYLQVSKYFIALKDTEYDPSQKMTVAIISAANASHDELLEMFPNFTFERRDSADDCLEAVRNGEADLILDNRYSMENVLAAPQNSDFTILPTQAVTQNICAKLIPRNDGYDDMLVSILNKAIARLDSSETDLTLSNFAQKTSYKYSFRDFVYQYRFYIMAAGILLVLALVALNAVIFTKRRTRIMIQQDEMKLRNITNNINGGVVVLKADTGLEITYANKGFLELIGCDEKQFRSVENGSYLAFVCPDDFPKLQDAIDSEETELSFELRVKKADGSYLPALFNCSVGEKIDGEKELYCVIMDMTEQNRLLEQLKIDNRRTELILDRVDEAFYDVNMREHTISTSNSFFAKFGWTLPEDVDVFSEKLFREMWKAPKEDIDKLLGSTREMTEKKEPVSVTMRIDSITKHASIWCEVFQYPILAEDGSVASVIGLVRDVDEQVTEREKLIARAQRDPLTGLYNKEAFGTLVRDALVDMPCENHALVFIDLDRFKNLNDTLGHMTGDRAICEAADKLKIIFSSYDLLCRFGGDEFCIFVKDIPTETLRNKMEWLVEKLHCTYSGERGEVSITCSCGIACTDYSGFTFDALMKCADKALYYSKETGRDRFTFFREIPAEYLDKDETK